MIYLGPLCKHQETEASIVICHPGWMSMLAMDGHVVWVGVSQDFRKINGEDCSFDFNFQPREPPIQH